MRINYICDSCFESHEHRGDIKQCVTCGSDFCIRSYCQASGDFATSSRCYACVKREKDGNKTKT